MLNNLAFLIPKRHEHYFFSGRLKLYIVQGYSNITPNNLDIRHLYLAVSESSLLTSNN